ncbi:hypothetical protein [Chitinimonas sp.]|uniref:hypothetical protein n=1 Tax=Chitinimonas sp. TaxID=1934313 RepID=UPI002F94B4F2
MKMTIRTRSMTGLLLAGLTLTLASAEAAGRLRAGGVHANPDGGVSAGMVAVGRGPNGGAYQRGRALTTDGQGNAQAASGGRFRTASGATGWRKSDTQRSADGSVSHEGAFATSGAKGNVQSSGNYNKAADGTVSGSRNTTATGANGNSYTGSTQYDSANGVTHTGTCTDAAGNVISCR